MQIEIIHEAAATLGEGPTWDSKTQTLYWVDILEKRVYIHHADENGYIQLDEMPGCLVPTKKGRLLVAAKASFLELEPLDQTQDKSATGKHTVLASIIEPANNRFNDGKCDPAGRLLAALWIWTKKLPLARSTRSMGKPSRDCWMASASQTVWPGVPITKPSITSTHPRAKSKPSTMTCPQARSQTRAWSSTFPKRSAGQTA